MKWLIRRSGYYWPDMLEDCFKYYKGCQACQRFGKIQIVPASTMNPIIKPWPFRGWGMDMIDKINPPSSKGHQFILAITDYFTKWVEAVPMKAVTSRDVINVAEPLELFRLKCVIDCRTIAIRPTHFKRNNPLVCRVSARYNHGSAGSKQVYLARRRVYITE
jgi:hypothetical protein